MNKSCNCDLCKLAKAFTAIAKKCNMTQKAALDDVFERMASAETILDYQNYRATKRQSMMINKVRYIPEK